MTMVVHICSNMLGSKSCRKVASGHLFSDPAAQRGFDAQHVSVFQCAPVRHDAQSAPRRARAAEGSPPQHFARELPRDAPSRTVDARCNAEAR